MYLYGSDNGTIQLCRLYLFVDSATTQGRCLCYNLKKVLKSAASTVYLQSAFAYFICNPVYLSIEIILMKKMYVCRIITYLMLRQKNSLYISTFSISCTALTTVRMHTGTIPTKFSEKKISRTISLSEPYLQFSQWKILFSVHKKL